MPDATLLAGDVPVTVPGGVTGLLVSPGIDLRLPLFADAQARAVPVLSDIDLFAAEARAPITGITGSNGKSTVTTMLGRMLADAGVRVAVGGNLGTPALDLLDDAVEAYVLELSSFQLERSGPLPLAAGVVLNISPDHLDLHGDMAAYIAAKARIQARAKVLVVNRDDPEVARLAPAHVRQIGFTLGAPSATDYGLRLHAGENWLARGAELLLPATALDVRGRHNLANALAALALGEAGGLPVGQLLPGLRAYRPLPHRMALVAQRNGVTWINDSKATNVGAAVTSIASVDGPLVLIAGGDAKGASFESLAEVLRGRQCHVVLLGRDREVLAKVLEPVCTVERVPDMPAAVRAAAGAARPGSTVLLAPACSSLDMFRDYGARGDAFRDAVLALDGGTT
jgi:UDP-N-acetylmuramoylalanine--D-glutamate ligase